MAFSLAEGIGAIGSFLDFLLTNILVFVSVLFFALLFFFVQYLFYRIYKWVFTGGIDLFYKMMEGLKGSGLQKTIEKMFS